MSANATSQRPQRTPSRIGPPAVQWGRVYWRRFPKAANDNRAPLLRRRGVRWAMLLLAMGGIGAIWAIVVG